MQTIRTIFLCILLMPVLLQRCKKDNKLDDDLFVKPVGDRYGEIFTGGEYHFGPVDWEESKWTNAFGPYHTLIQEVEGDLLAGLELEHNGKGEICDACIMIETKFTIRVTAIDGQHIEDSYQSFSPGTLIESSKQF